MSDTEVGRAFLLGDFLFEALPGSSFVSDVRLHSELENCDLELDFQLGLLAQKTIESIAGM